MWHVLGDVWWQVLGEFADSHWSLLASLLHTNQALIHHCLPSPPPAQQWPMAGEGCPVPSVMEEKQEEEGGDVAGSTFWTSPCTHKRQRKRVRATG